MTIDPAQPLPLYVQLKTLLLEEILGGRYGPGERLPTEHELCDRYGISRTPVSRALSELADEGLVLRQRRLGTFVNPHGLHRRPDRAELRVVVTDGPWEQMIRDTSPATQVNIVTVPRSSLHQTLTHAVAEGQAPDLAVLDSVWAREFAAAGFLYALEELDEDWAHSEHEIDFLEPLVAVNQHRGRTFGVSTFASVAGLWCRRRELESRGLEPPATWAALRMVARAIAQDSRGPKPIVLPGGSMGGETTAYCLIGLLASNGAEVLGPDGVTLDSRTTAQALRFLRGLIDDGLMSANVVGYEWDRPMRLLADGQAAMSFGGSYEAHPLAKALGVPLEELGQHLVFLPFPAGPRGAQATVTGAMSYGIFRQAANPELAMRVLKGSVASGPLARVARVTGRIPPRRSAVALAAPHLPFIAETAAMLDLAVNRPSTPLYPRVSAQLQAMLEAVLTGRLGPAAAARHTSELIGAITGLPVLHESTRRTPLSGNAAQ